MLSTLDICSYWRNVQRVRNLSTKRWVIVCCVSCTTLFSIKTVNFQLTFDAWQSCPFCTIVRTLSPRHQQILPAMGKFYHPKCFKCCICSQCLDGKFNWPLDDLSFKYAREPDKQKKLTFQISANQQKLPFVMYTQEYPSQSWKIKYTVLRTIKSEYLGTITFGGTLKIHMNHRLIFFWLITEIHIDICYRIYSPKCAACGNSIAPLEGTGETVRVVSMVGIS